MNKFISYAQNCEDVILWRALHGIANGRYMDIGANHPLHDSVTKAFYDRGWTGVNVEPIKSLYEQLTAERPRDINLCCAISSISGKTKFYEVVDSMGLSTLDATIADSHVRSGLKVQAYDVAIEPISNICSVHDINELHFLKIDVEGAELSVLQGIPFGRLRPWIIVVEATVPNTQIPTHHKWESILLDNGYMSVYFDGANKYYLSDTHAELLPAFCAPPSVFDNYLQYSVYSQLLNELNGARQESGAYKRRLDEIRTSASWKVTRPLRAIQYVLSVIRGTLKR